MKLPSEKNGFENFFAKTLVPKVIIQETYLQKLKRNASLFKSIARRRLPRLFSGMKKIYRSIIKP